jgi:hypothetical protein
MRLTPKKARLMDAGVRQIGMARVSTLAQTSVTRSASVNLQDRAMVKRIAPIRVVSFFLLAACGALGQSDHSSADLLLGLSV